MSSAGSVWRSGANPILRRPGSSCRGLSQQGRGRLLHVGNAAGEKTHRIHAGGKGKDAGDRQASVGGLEPGDPAVAGRPVDRSRRLGTQPQPDHPAGHGRGRAAAGASGSVAGIPGIAGDSGIQKSQAGGDGLGQDEGAQRQQALHHAGVFPGRRLREKVHVAAGRHALDVDDVLDPQRPAAQRPHAAPPVALPGPVRVPVHQGPDGSLPATDGCKLLFHACSPEAVTQPGFRNLGYNRPGAIPTEPARRPTPCNPSPCC